MLKASCTNTEEREILEVSVTNSLLIAYAQELYVLFLISVLSIVQDIGGRTILDRQSLRLVNENISSLFDVFTANGSGSSGDAFSCITPALKKHGKLLNINGLHPRDAIEAGIDQDTVVQLLKSGNVSNPDAKDQDGLTPLVHATSKGYGKVVKALFDTGKVAGLEALRVSVEKQDCHIAKTILETGQVRLHSAEQAESPHLLLHTAVEKGSEGMIRLLLNDKAPPDEKYNSGWTPLCVAVDKGFDKIVKLLVQTGEVDLDYRYPGRHSHYLKFKARLNWAHHADEEIPEALSQAQKWGGYPLLCVAAEKGLQCNHEGAARGRQGGCKCQAPRQPLYATHCSG